MSCRLLLQLTHQKSSTAQAASSLRTFYSSSERRAVLDFFRKKKTSVPERIAAKEEEKNPEQIFSLEDDSPPALTEEEIDKKRDVSRLKDYHRRLVHGEMPHPDGPMFWTHHTLIWKRKMFGKYGEQSGINPAILWPTSAELRRRITFEKVCNPHTIPELINRRKQLRAAEQEAFEKREREVDEAMKKLDKFKKELVAKQEAKEREQRQATQRREKLMEEVRRHFGYTMDPREEKFQELLAQKEKEQRKAMKEARKIEKQQRALDKLAAPTAGTAKVKSPSSKNTDDEE